MNRVQRASALWIGGASALSLIASWAVLSGAAPVWAVPGLLMLLGIAVAWPKPVARTYILTTIGALLIVSSSSTFVSEGSVMTVLLRVIGLSLLSAAGLLARAGMSDLSVAGARNQPNAKWLGWISGSLLVYLVFATALHGLWVEFIAYSIGLILMSVTVLLVVKQVDPHIVMSGIVTALAVVAGLSFLQFVFDPSNAIVQGRLRGVTTNANLLGFFAFLLGAIALIGVRSAARKGFLLGLAVITIALTGSRASALALAIVVAGLFFTRRTVGAFLGGVAVILIAILGMVIAPEFLTLFDLVLRGNNSRAGSFDVALAHFEAEPLAGVGMGQESAIIASSPLRAIAHAGVGGLIAIVGLWWGLLSRSVRTSAPSAVFAFAAIVHSVFEGWLLSPVGPMLLVFLLGWSAVAGLEGRRHGRSPTPVLLQKSSRSKRGRI